MTELTDLDLDEMAVDLRRERSVARFRDAALACVEKSYRLEADDLAKPDYDSGHHVRDTRPRRGADDPVRDSDAVIFASVATEELTLEYLLARLRVEAGKAAASLLAAVTEHAGSHGSGDTWTVAAAEAVEALSDLASAGVSGPDTDTR